MYVCMYVSHKYGSPLDYLGLNNFKIFFRDTLNHVNIFFIQCYITARRVRNFQMAIDYSKNLFKNVHSTLSQPQHGESYLVNGDYEYWHYACDGINDRGWGCGYRTLQTICSWIKENLNIDEPVPTLKDIQEILVRLEDKETSFLGSREWIGSFEVCLVIDQRYDVQSKIIHVPNGRDLPKFADTVKNHFTEFGSPIMMGGDRDCSSKGIMGIHYGTKGEIHLLVVDPHFFGKPKNLEQLANDRWVKWQNLTDFVDSSFYNLCLPQIKCKFLKE